jgi:alcohol dehydrogenase class IV
MRFIAETDCFFGPDRYEALGEVLRSTTRSSGLVIVDDALVQQPAFSAVLRRLETSLASRLDMYPVHFEQEPTYDQLDDAAAEIRLLDPHFIVAIGGGSTMDLAKGIAVLLENPGRGRDYRGMGLVTSPARALLALPTTAGTGAEVTWTASFIDAETDVKLGINGPNVFPRAALLEPALLVGCPRQAALSSALDALVHAVESISSPMQTPIVRSLAVGAVDLLFKNVIPAVKEGDLESWAGMQMGAYMAGLAMLNSSGGVASGVSYPIGVHGRIPHGFAGGVLLPYVVASNTAKGYAGYEVLKVESEGKETFSEELARLYLDLNVPRDFSEWDIAAKVDIETLTELVMSQRAASLKLNPTMFDRSELVALLEMVCPTP